MVGIRQRIWGILAILGWVCSLSGCRSASPRTADVSAASARPLPAAVRAGSPAKDSRPRSEAAETAGRILLTADASESEGAVAAIIDDAPTAAVERPQLEAEATPVAPAVLAERAAVVHGSPVDLAGVLQLADGQNPQVAFARERINEALAQVDRAEVLWLPSLRAGVNYNKHEGAIQDVAGNVFNTSRSALYAGMGANAVGAASPAVPGLVANFHLTDAVFQPRIAGHQASSRKSAASAAANDLLRDAAWAYLELLRSHQELAIARETRDNTARLTELTRLYAQTGQGLAADNDRAQAELAIRDNDILRAEEAVQVASAQLAQLMHVDPTWNFEPQEPTVVPIELVSADAPAAELVAQGLTHRPELAESRFLVCEAVERLKREQYAPLVPSVLLGVSYGGFGGGLGGTISNFNNRLDTDAVAYWEVRNLGLGEQAARGESQSRLEQARLREVAVLDRVAREVVEARAQVQSRRHQIATARNGIQAALNSYERNLTRIQNAQGLPIEVLQSIQALAQARREYLRAVIDYNRAQFSLHRALGCPVS